MVEKQYHALVRNVPDPLEGVINAPVGHVDGQSKSKGGRVPRCWVFTPKSKSATTHYAVREQYAYLPPGISELMRPQTGQHALVELSPRSGRTHQLRVHMAWIGCPLVGDRLYMLDDVQYVQWRENRSDPSYSDWLDRHALHCSRVAFEHPYTGERCTIEAPLADDMQRLIDRLRNNETAQCQEQ